jgi:hypothetical protein
MERIAISRVPLSTTDSIIDEPTALCVSNKNIFVGYAKGVKFKQSFEGLGRLRD